MSRTSAVDDKNRYEPRVYPDDSTWHHEAGPCGAAGRSARGSRSPALRLHDELGWNEISDVVSGDRERRLGEREPVALFSMSRGQWAERKGEGAAVYYIRRTPTMSSRWPRPSRRRGSTMGLGSCLPMGGAELSEFPALAFLARRIPDEHHLRPRESLPNEERPEDERRLCRHLRTSRRTSGGQYPDAGDGPGGNIFVRRDVPLLDHSAHGSGEGERARIEFLQEDRGTLYANDTARSTRRGRLSRSTAPRGGRDRHVRQGRVVFWDAPDRMGRDANLAGIQEYPSLQGRTGTIRFFSDFTATMRPFAPTAHSYDDFVKQWFHEVVVPEYRLDAAEKVRIPRPAGRRPCGIENIGTGRMPVEIAAVKGEAIPEVWLAHARLRRCPRVGGPRRGGLDAGFDPCGFGA